MNGCNFLILGEEVKLPVYVTAVGGDKTQKYTERVNGYPEYHWIHCVKGKGILIIENCEFTISQNMGFLILPNTPHEYYPIEEPWETHWITFMGYGVSDILNSLGINKSGVFTIYEIHLFDRLISDIWFYAQSKSLNKGYKCSAILYSIFVELKDCMTYSTSKPSNDKIQSIIEFISNNYYRNPTINEMAEIVDISPQYLCRLFTSKLKMRPFEYLTKLRLQKAKEILLSTQSMSISDIATSVGYNDLSYFCAIFKKHEGITPREYGEIYKL